MPSRIGWQTERRLVVMKDAVPPPIPTGEPESALVYTVLSDGSELRKAWQGASGDDGIAFVTFPEP